MMSKNDQNVSPNLIGQTKFIQRFIKLITFAKRRNFK